MKTKILKIKGDWEEVVDDCRATVNKPPLGKAPSTEFKKKMVIMEHSPIRNIHVKWFWEHMPHWVTVHWVRHMWECYVQTQRSDRTGIPRDKLPQNEPQNFTGDANTQNLIDTWRKRLCRTASPQTRDYAEDFKVELRNYEPEIADGLVPNCVYRCGCPEKDSGCHLFDTLCATDDRFRSTDIQERYDAYNEWFYRYRKTIEES